MKKITTLFILILTLALGTVAFSACVPGVSGESDMYGSFFLSGSDTLPDGSRCVTLKENNVGIVEMIGNSEQPYYADYDFVANTVELHVDDNAARALTGDRAVSLLPVGITRVAGDFEKDDIVKIIDPQGRLLGVGKAQCDSATARLAAGQKNQKPVIHYDYLYIE